MSKILILGGTRFFGKQLVYNLLEHEHEVTVATRGLTKDPFGKRVNRLIIDRAVKSTLINAFKNKSWDIVYDQTSYSPKEGLYATQALKGKVKRYIFTSSQSVYDFGTNRKEEEFNPLTFSFLNKNKQEYLGFKGYQEGKRAVEALLFNDTAFEVVAARFPIVVGKDDHTKRLAFHVHKVLNNESIGISEKELRYSFIRSDEAADFLYDIGQSAFTGAINPGCSNDIALEELIQKIESRTGEKASITKKVTNENASPYELEGSCSINTEKATGLGFTFSNIDNTFDHLIDYYSEKLI
ncbi:NAD-dependent epimerase/dehydratase family protein [Oceanobacillus saliphilus]|uniref:NAD-dependent epimerase/dehydratase family protein n=1 Tax=Oceanobacillus saliphilus TaxID=2925834 RepID=UPI00201DC99B|nr:NAD-dependent epimerase/dehydratase family protein [Oceanobacillus saliphilus]